MLRRHDWPPPIPPPVSPPVFNQLHPSHRSEPRRALPTRVTAKAGTRAMRALRNSLSFPTYVTQRRLFSQRVTAIRLIGRLKLRSNTFTPRQPILIRLSSHVAGCLRIGLERPRPSNTAHFRTALHGQCGWRHHDCGECQHHLPPGNRRNWCRGRLHQRADPRHAQSH